MQAVEAKDYKVVFNQEGYKHLHEILKNKEYSILFILVDTNTHEHCLAPFLANLETHNTLEVIEIDSGEEFKNLETCTGVWNVLSELNCDRKSLMINLGGGVVTDLGGFVASAFKRGIDFINIPTSLLAMVDASIGGKTGVDLGNLKNQIGVIQNPKAVLIDTQFLGTLPLAELRSGYAEMLKHGLISNQEYWDAVISNSYQNLESLNKLIYGSVSIKNQVVLNDPYEDSLRKTLNYGHTLGHAIESYFLSHQEKERLLHGEAIAIGMVLANYLSKQLTGLKDIDCDAYSKTILSFYKPVHFTNKDIEHIIGLLKFDKKNVGGRVNFVLLQKLGQAKVDCEVSNDLIYEAFEYYAKLSLKYS